MISILIEYCHTFIYQPVFLVTGTGDVEISCKYYQDED